MVTLRAARATDAFRIVQLLVETQGKSRFAGAVAIDEPYARKTVAALIHRHGGIHDGGTCAYVATDGAGEIEGFIIGLLDRVYHVGDMLCANDVFLVCSDRADATAMPKLVSAYLDWADTNPKVYEIHLSWSDALETGCRMGPVFMRKGFTRCGEVFRRDRASIFEREAA